EELPPPPMRLSRALPGTRATAMDRLTRLARNSRTPTDSTIWLERFGNGQRIGMHATTPHRRPIQKAPHTVPTVCYAAALGTRETIPPNLHPPAPSIFRFPLDRRVKSGLEAEILAEIAASVVPGINCGTAYRSACASFTAVAGPIAS